MRRQQVKRKKHYSWWWLIAVPILGLIFFLLQNSECFKYASSFNLVVSGKNGDLNVINFDNKNLSITTVVIPGSTQLSVSRQLGTWKARGLFQLGENEGYSGSLMSETIMKDFFFPVNAWADSGASGLVQGNLSGVLKAVFYPYKTNLKLGDRIKLALLSFKVTGYKKDQINLQDSGVIKSAKLMDGENGYVVTGVVSPQINSIFSDDLFSQKEVRILIKNYSQNGTVAENIGSVIEVLGAKVSAISQEESRDINCLVIGKDAALVNVFRSLFSCDKKVGSIDGGFDVEIDLGEQFVKKY